MAEPQKNSAAKIEWLTAILISAAILFLHLYFWQHAGALWRDEVNTVNLAQNPDCRVLSHDSFPVLMPFAVKIWSRFGGSDLWLRLLGTLCGLLLPLAFWFTARATKKPPLFSLVLFGLNSLLIIYSDSLRAYGLGSALLVFALAATLKLLEQPSWSQTGTLAFIALLAVQTLFQNSILFFAICLGAFAVCARRKDFSTAIKIFCAGTIAAISLLPYLPNFMTLPQAAVELRRGFSMFVTNLNFEIATAFPFPAFSLVWKILAVAVVICAAISFFKPTPGEEKKRDLKLFAAITIASVCVLFLAFLKYAAAGARPWYFIPPLALAAVCFDLGISLECFPRLARTTIFGLLLGTACAAVLFASQDLRGHFTNADQLAAQVEKKSSPEDFVVVTPWFCGITFDRYFHSRSPWTTLPPLADHATHRYDQVLDEMKNTNSLTPVLEKISATLRAGHRVWVVGLMDFPATNSAEPSALPPPPLKDFGWSDTPYIGSWRDRTAFFLAQHSLKFEDATPRGDSAPIFQENLRLLCAEGWRE
jgi:hypothetical protein